VGKNEGRLEKSPLVFSRSFAPAPLSERLEQANSCKLNFSDTLDLKNQWEGYQNLNYLGLKKQVQQWDCVPTKEQT